MILQKIESAKGLCVVELADVDVLATKMLGRYSDAL